MPQIESRLQISRSRFDEYSRYSEYGQIQVAECSTQLLSDRKRIFEDHSS